MLPALCIALLGLNGPSRDEPPQKPAAPAEKVAPRPADSDAPLAEGWPDATKPGKVEVKTYPAYRSAVARAKGASTPADNVLFWPLFNHISRKGIEMTTPVRIDAAATGGQPEIAMRFSLPVKVAGNPPAPIDPRVRIVTVPPSTVAALRYSGNPTEAARSAHQQDLFRRLVSTGWQPAGTPYALNYDPPFAVPFLKRNEVVVEVSRR